LARDLTQNHVVSGQISDDKRGAPFSSLQIRLRKRQNYNFADYRFGHAASSSGVSQSLRRVDFFDDQLLRAHIVTYRRIRCGYKPLLGAIREKEFRAHRSRQGILSAADPGLRPGLLSATASRLADDSNQAAAFASRFGPA
jgi:hypothetical protein